MVNTARGRHVSGIDRLCSGIPVMIGWAAIGGGVEQTEASCKSLRQVRETRFTYGGVSLARRTVAGRRVDSQHPLAHELS